MLSYVSSSIFDSPAQTLVNPVNTVGVMGAGLAKQFKARWPDMFDRYRQHCASGRLVVGTLHLYRSPDRWILNFPTKQHWRDPSSVEWIQSGLKKFAASYRDRGITSISFPMLGTGCGGLSRDDVRPVMEERLSQLPISVHIHDY